MIKLIVGLIAGIAVCLLIILFKMGRDEKLCWAFFRRHKFGEPFKRTPDALTWIKQCERCPQILPYIPKRND